MQAFQGQKDDGDALTFWQTNNQTGQPLPSDRDVGMQLKIIKK